MARIAGLRLRERWGGSTPVHRNGFLSRDSERRRTETGRSPMNTVISADGTAIAFDRFGDGPPVIMTVGAFNTRSTTEPLATALQEHLTVLNYDRRGRGDSGDTAPYAVDREIEDIAALIGGAGGSASAFGYSSGATLALQAAASGLPITKLVLYEPPFRTDDSHPGLPADFAGQLAGLVAAGRPARHGHDSGPGDQRRTEPAVPAGCGPGSCGGAARRAVAQPCRPGPRHQPGSNCTRRRGIPHHLAPITTSIGPAGPAAGMSQHCPLPRA